MISRAGSQASLHSQENSRGSPSPIRNDSQLSQNKLPKIDWVSKRNSYGHRGIPPTVEASGKTLDLLNKYDKGDIRYRRDGYSSNMASSLLGQHE